MHCKKWLTALMIGCFLLIQNLSAQEWQINFEKAKDLAQKNDNNIVLVFQGSDWCAPCIKEIPELNEFAHENKDIFVFTFNFDQLDKEDLAPIAKKFNIEVPSLVTHPRDIWGIQTPPAVPATFFINPNGELSLSLFRPQTKDALNDILLDLKQAF